MSLCFRGRVYIFGSFPVDRAMLRVALSLRLRGVCCGCKTNDVLICLSTNKCMVRSHAELPDVSCDCLEERARSPILHWDQKVILQVFIAINTADGPAMTYLNGLVGHHGKIGCCLYCPVPGRHKLMVPTTIQPTWSLSTMWCWGVIPKICHSPFQQFPHQIYIFPISTFCSNHQTKLNTRNQYFTVPPWCCPRRWWSIVDHCC